MLMVNRLQMLYFFLIMPRYFDQSIYDLGDYSGRDIISTKHSSYIQMVFKSVYLARIQRICPIIRKKIGTISSPSSVCSLFLLKLSRDNVRILAKWFKYLCFHLQIQIGLIFFILLFVVMLQGRALKIPFVL